MSISLDDLKPFIDWLQANPTWAGVATFVLSIMESLAVVGMLIPGTLVMGAIGSLIGSGVLPAFSITAWAAAGAIVGDGISYWLGHHYHSRIRVMWPFKRFPVLLAKGEQFFLKHGGKSVFMGRFIGPIRPIIPVVAGMMNMPPNRFTIANIFSAIAWAPIYMLPGYLIGSLSVQLAPQTATRFLVIAIVILLGLWVSYWIIKRLYQVAKQATTRLLIRLWAIIDKHPKLLSVRYLLQDVQRTNQRNPLGLVLLLVVAFIYLVYITIRLYKTSPAAHPWNYFALHVSQSLRFNMLDHIATVITLLTRLEVLLAVSGVILCWLLLSKSWRAASHWFFNILLVLAGAFLLQRLLQMPFPIATLTRATAFSYPSITIALLTAISTQLSLLITRQLRKKYHFICYAAAIIIIAIIGLARLYLGLDWLLDIYGGCLLGLSSALLAALSYRRKISLNPQITSLLAVTLLTWAISGGLMLRLYPKALQEYQSKPQDYNLSSANWWQAEKLPIPYYRYNLWGKPVQLMNVQWAGNLDLIVQDLSRQGWIKVPKANLAIILNRIAAKDRAQQLPLLPDLYLDRKPELIMTKTVATNKSLLVLRLWDADLHWTNKKLPIWIGTLDYRQLWQPPFSSHKELSINTASQPLEQILIANLRNFVWKKALLQPGSELAKLDNQSILLIQPK